MEEREIKKKYNVSRFSQNNGSGAKKGCSGIKKGLPMLGREAGAKERVRFRPHRALVVQRPFIVVARG